MSVLFRWLQSATPKIKTLTQSIGNKIKEIIHVPSMNTIIKGAVAAEGIIENVLTGQPNDFDIDFAKIVIPPHKDDPNCAADSTNCDLISKDAKSVQTPWDADGILLKSWGTAPSESDLIKGQKLQTKPKGQFLNVYCVKCGVQGSAKVSGSITIKGINVIEGHVDVGVSMNIGLGVGTYAQLLRSEQFDVNLFNVPIYPFTIGVLTVGPFVSIDAKTDLTLNATGTALVRADASISNAKFSYDFKTGKATQVGFKPVFKPLFQAEGEIDVLADFGVPVGLKVGVSTMKGCSHCEGSIGVQNYPYIKATAQAGLEASASLNSANKVTGSGGFKETNGCKGIFATLSIGNDVSLTFDGFGFATGQYDVYKSAEYQIKSWCLNKDTKLKQRSIGSHGYNVSHYARDGLNGTTFSNSTSSNSNSTDVVDLTHYAVSDHAVTEYQGANIPNHAYSLGGDNEDFWFTTVAYTTANGPNKDYVLASCNNGNIYMMKNADINNLDWKITCSAIWRGYDGAILTDSNQAIMHYYKNTMDKTGVSRIRVAHPQVVPDTAAVVILAPYYFDDANPSSSVLAAYDDSDNVLFPVVCQYSDSTASKIYLVRADIEEGISTLKSRDLKYTVTNGDVSGCSFLPLNWGVDTDATQPDWASDNGYECLNNPGAYKADIAVDKSAFNNNGKLIEVVEQVDDDSFFDVFTQPMFAKSTYFTN